LTIPQKKHAYIALGFSAQDRGGRLKPLPIPAPERPGNPTFVMIELALCILKKKKTPIFH